MALPPTAKLHGEIGRRSGRAGKYYPVSGFGGTGLVSNLPADNVLSEPNRADRSGWPTLAQKGYLPLLPPRLDAFSSAWL